MRRHQVSARKRVMRVSREHINKRRRSVFLKHRQAPQGHEHPSCRLACNNVRLAVWHGSFHAREREKESEKERTRASLLSFLSRSQSLQPFCFRMIILHTNVIIKHHHKQHHASCLIIMQCHIIILMMKYVSKCPPPHKRARYRSWGSSKMSTCLCIETS